MKTETTPTPDFKPFDVEIRGNEKDGWNWKVTFKKESVVMGHEKTFDLANRKMSACLKGEKE